MSEQFQLGRNYAEDSGDQNPANRQAESSACPSTLIGMPWSVFNMVLKQNLVKLIMNTDIILMDKPCGTGKISHGALVFWDYIEKTPSMWWLKEQKFMVSEFWIQEACNQGVSRKTNGTSYSIASFL